MKLKRVAANAIKRHPLFRHDGSDQPQASDGLRLLKVIAPTRIKYNNNSIR